jgi:hypothetical protein
LDARLTTLLYKKSTVAKSKEVKRLKRGCFADDDDDVFAQLLHMYEGGSINKVTSPLIA